MKRFTTLCLSAAISFCAGPAAFGHGAFPLNLHVLKGSFGSRTNPLLQNGLSGSLSNRSIQLALKNTAISSILAGKNAVRASALVSAIPNGGQLQGDFYIQLSPGVYYNLGEYNFTNQNFPFYTGLVFSSPGASVTTPGFPNSLSFQNVVFGNSPATRGVPITFGKSVHAVVLSGNAARLQNQLNAVAAKGYKLGLSAPFSGGSIIGGEFSGTFFTGLSAVPPTLQFEPAFFGSDARFIFAFGNNPLNNPGGVFGTSSPSLSNYFQFSNGILKTVSSGQLGGSFTNTFGGGQFPFFAAFGSSPLNIGLAAPNLTNPAHFLFFK